MALGDVVPCGNPHGGHDSLVYFPIKATQAFLAGDIVKLVATEGTLQVNVDEPTLEATMYCAAEGSYIQPAGTVQKAVGTFVGVYPMTAGTRWLCKNYSTDAAGTAAAITPSTIRGTAGGFVLDASSPANWFADTHTNTNKCFIIEDVVSVPSATTGLYHQRLYTATSQTAGTFAVIVRMARDFVAGAA